MRWLGGRSLSVGSSYLLRRAWAACAPPEPVAAGPPSALRRPSPPPCPRSSPTAPPPRPPGWPAAVASRLLAAAPPAGRPAARATRGTGPRAGLGQQQQQGKRWGQTKGYDDSDCTACSQADKDWPRVRCGLGRRTVLCGRGVGLEQAHHQLGRLLLRGLDEHVGGWGHGGGHGGAVGLADGPVPLVVRAVGQRRGRVEVQEAGPVGEQHGRGLPRLVDAVPVHGRLALAHRRKRAGERRTFTMLQLPDTGGVRCPPSRGVALPGGRPLLPPSLP